MARIRGNFVTGTLTSAIGSETTSITSAGLAQLPAVGGGDTAYLTLDPFRDAGEPEIVVVTDHTAGSTSATVLRGQENTQKRAHADGTIIINGVVASDLGLLESSIGSVIGSPGSAVATGPGATLQVGQAAGEGGSNSISRADHAHAVPIGMPSGSAVGDSAATGSSGQFAAADHQHGREVFESNAANLRSIPNTASSTATRGFVGTSNKPARADHTHYIADDGVVARMLAPSAVTNDKLANGAVSASKVALLTTPVKASYTPSAAEDLTPKSYVDARVEAGGYGALANHGGDANYTRPNTAGAVLWRGVIEPTNAIDGDDWLDYS